MSNNCEMTEPDENGPPGNKPYSPAIQAADLDEGPLLRLREVERITTLDQKTIDRLVAQERFPAPVQLSERRRAWKRRDVRDWLADPLGWVNF